MLDDVDLLVCGAGPAGSVVAERAAAVLGWKVLVIDQRSHVAGNCHDSTHASGVLVHNYGPHYFRTSDARLLAYLSRFTDWHEANYEVRSLVRGQLLPFPINLTTLEAFFGTSLTPETAAELLARKRHDIPAPTTSEEQVLSKVGPELYDAFYRGYTLKQWGVGAAALDPGVCGRIPVRLNRDARYVDHKFQVMPTRGFTALFRAMLKHRRIRVLLGCKYDEVRTLIRPRRATVFTGPIDEYFGHRLGRLPYRSLRFDFVAKPVEFAQPCVQVNYPNDFAYTRSVEIKHVTGQRHAHTVVSYETPSATGDPFYPVPRAENRALYAKYAALAEQERVRNGVYFCGRLAQYRYFNTDEVIQEALRCFSQLRAERGNTDAVRVDPGRLSGPAPPPDFRVKNLYEPSPADESERVRWSLPTFGRVEFPSRGGLGFRAIQAKRAGLAFADAELVVRFDGAAQLDREAAERWPANLDELERDFMERFAFENADAVIDPAGAAAALGWTWTPPPPPLAAVQPAVTIGIAYYNLGAHLPATLASVAAQTYAALDVVVINDGSTDATSLSTFVRMEETYPQFRFVWQANAGIGATRNRCLDLARGEFFLPMDADNVARPDMVERFVVALNRNPQFAAMSCYFLAFEEKHAAPAGEYLFALRPVGGPYAAAAVRNVYGDANSIFRTNALRAAGGYGTDRGTSCEDWEAFIRLVQAGGKVGVVPDHLFYYRHRAGGFSRVTNWYKNHQRVLRQFAKADHLPPGEAAALWAALLGFQQEAARLTDERRAWRYRAADRIAGVVKWITGRGERPA